MTSSTADACDASNGTIAGLPFLLAFTSRELHGEKRRQAHDCRYSGRDEAYSVGREIDNETEKGRTDHDPEIPCRRHGPHGEAPFGLGCPVHDESQQGRIHDGCGARQEHRAREERHPSRWQREEKEAERERRDGGLERSEERRVGKECRSRWSPYH